VAVCVAVLTSACAGALRGGRASAAPASGALGSPQLLPPGTGVAIVGGGVVWFDEGRIVFQGFAGGSAATLGWGLRYAAPSLQSSAGSVAGLVGEGRFVGGVLPGRVRPMYQPVAVPGGECAGGWVPDSGTSPNFVVTGTKIISAGECEPDEGMGFEPEAHTRQPLFSHDVRGGEWRVWRWLSGDLPPVLAAEGGLLAVGELLEPPSASPVAESPRRMRVSIIDTRNGATRARSMMPAGSLAFAAPDRLVLTIISKRLSPHKRLPPHLAASLSERPLVEKIRPAYYSRLYSTGGRRIADLGNFQELPRVSHMHLLTEEPVLSVRSIPGGRPSPLIGFDAPQRTLVGLAFQWPALALEETTATALPADQVNCRSGYYSAPSSPFITVIDLARPHTYEPPPQPSPLEPQNLLARCPIVAHDATSATRGAEVDDASVWGATVRSR
jgi:hypothetical protein